MCRNILLFLFVGLFVACMGCQSTSTSTAAKQYFDLAGYINSQVESLQKVSARADRTVSLNGKSETAIVSPKDWQEELSIFAESDINKPAFVGKYVIDTVQNKDGGQQISYTATEPKLKTQKITLQFAPQAPQTPTVIVIENATDNSLYRISEQLVYEYRKGYSVKSHQTVKFLQPQYIYVVTNFVY